MRRLQPREEKPWMKWLKPAIPAVLLFILVAVIKHLFTAPDAKTAVGILSDCFTVPGVLLAGVGLITWIATFGQFDLMGYSTRKFFGHFIHSLSEDLPTEFYEYRKQKDEKGRFWLKHTFFVGAGCLAVGIVILIGYLVI